MEMYEEDIALKQDAVSNNVSNLQSVVSILSKLDLSFRKLL